MLRPLPASYSDEFVQDFHLFLFYPKISWKDLRHRLGYGAGPGESFLYLSRPDDLDES